jgi:hypothetical protein
MGRGGEVSTLWPSPICAGKMYRKCRSSPLLLPLKNFKSISRDSPINKPRSKVSREVAQERGSINRDGARLVMIMQGRLWKGEVADGHAVPWETIWR